MRVSFGLYFPRCGEIWVSKTAFPALWRHLDKNVLINHLLTVSNIDFRILDNRCAQDTNLMTIFHPLPQFFIEFKLHSENIARRPSPPPPPPPPNSEAWRRHCLRPLNDHMQETKLNYANC
jgi:hypothetical protein